MNRTTQDALRIHMRWMIRRDMPEVIAIEAASFEYAWTEKNFLDCLRQRNCIGMVVEHGDKIIGFMIYGLHYTKLSVINLAVHPSWRQRGGLWWDDGYAAGVGSSMAAKLIGKLSSHRRTSITLEVRESNLAAQMFFRSCGFKAVRTLRGWFEDSGEDAYRFRYDLGGK